MIGSTEWVEKHQDELKQKAVVYLNSDSSGRGWIHVSGSHTLEEFATEVAESVQQPDTKETLVAAQLGHAPVDDDPEAPAPKKQKLFTIGALGAGSDYVAFLDYLGIASMDEGFGGKDKSGIYHSVYDSLYWFNHFSDATHIYGRGLAQYTALALVRLSDTDILPFEFTHFETTVTGYADEIEKESEGKGHKLKLTELRKQLEILKSASEKYERALSSAVNKSSLDQTRLAQLNQTLFQTERMLLRPEGLPNRSWYKHQIYAPGFYTGYEVKTLPGIREAVDAKDWKLAKQEESYVAECLARLNDKVSQATEQAEGL